MALKLRTCECGHKNTAHSDVIPETEWEEPWDGCLFCPCLAFERRRGGIPAEFLHGMLNTRVSIRKGRNTDRGLPL